MNLTPRGSHWIWNADQALVRVVTLEHERIKYGIVAYEIIGGDTNRYFVDTVIFINLATRVVPSQAEAALLTLAGVRCRVAEVTALTASPGRSRPGRT